MHACWPDASLALATEKGIFDMNKIFSECVLIPTISVFPAALLPSVGLVSHK